MKNVIKTLSVSALILCCSLLSSAREYEKAVHRNLWNSTHNIAGIRMDSTSISTAKLFGTYEAGEFRDTYMAESSWTAGANAKSIAHMERFTLNGAFSFENMEGNGMCGSMSSRPGYYPIDVLEFTPGHKTMQTYHIQGGISIDFSETVLLGIGLDYNARNYTKRKDLRHTTWLMDMTANIGLITKLGDETMLGISYLFNKSSEKFNAEELGISSGSYYAFHDKGMMFGVHDVWTGGGTHLKEGGINGFPTMEQRHGAGLQFDSKDFLVELEYIYGAGKSGEKNVKWYNFPSHEVEMTAGYKFLSGKTEHFLHLDASYKTLNNKENVIVKETDGGITDNITYGSNQIFARKTFKARLAYEVMTEKWAAWANAAAENTGRLSSTIYPYVYSDLVFVGKAQLGAMVKLWKFDIKADFIYSRGQKKFNEKNIQEDIEVDKKPYMLTDWYNISVDYQTTPKLLSSLSLRFNFWKGLYVEAEGRYLKAFNPQYISGQDRFSGNFNFGYTF